MSSFCKSACDFPKTYQVPEFELTKNCQGLRGTCVAFSAVALLNYLYRKENKKFSPQFLYARCKQEDRDASDGISIENAFECIKKYGVCQEKIWLYDINETESCTDESVLSTLPVESCADVNFQMLPSPRNVDEYKKILCGAAGNVPMPVVFGCSIFASGILKNWLQEPAPGDRSEDGHAVLLYGWQDTPGLCSRGYFLAQNSLNGNGDDGSGKLRIPFEYIEKYGLAAGTVVCEAGKTEIVCNTESAVVAAEAGSDSRNTAVQAACQKVEISAIKSNFFSTIRENICKAPYFYPDLCMPFFKSLQINQVNVENVLSTEENCTDDFKRWLMTENLIVAKDISVVLYWFKIDRRCCWCLTCAFFAVSEGDTVIEDDIKTLQRYIKISCGCRPDVRHFFFTLGTNTNFSSACNVSSNPTVLLCEYRENNLWTHKVPMFERGQVGDEFLVHIMPGQYKEKIEEIIHGWKIEDGHIREQKLLIRLGFDSDNLDLATVRMALDDIFANGGYAKKKSGEIIPYEFWGRQPPPDAKKCYRYTTCSKKMENIRCRLWWSIKILQFVSIISVLLALVFVIMNAPVQVWDKDLSWEVVLSWCELSRVKIPLILFSVGVFAGIMLQIIRKIHGRLKYNLIF